MTDRPIRTTGEPTSSRARGRELALLSLCHVESYPEEERESALALLFEHAPAGDGTDEIELTAVQLNSEPAVQKFARKMVSGLLPNWAEIDSLIEAKSQKWRLERMDCIDRNLIRLATYELKWSLQTPTGVITAEAVRLASRYGSERSPKFVNGLVDALARSNRVAEGS